MSFLTGITSQALFTNHLGQSGGRSLSPRIWTKFYGQGGSPDGAANAYGAADDFLSFNGTVSANVGTYSSQGGGYRSYEDTGNSISTIATEVGGVLRITTDGTDNDESWLCAGGATNVQGKVSSTGGRMLAFEARIRLGQAVTQNMFIGLTEEGCAAADFITDAGAMGDKDLLGFWILEGASTSLRFGYRKQGSALQALATAATISASTWYKVGFLYSPSEVESKRIKFFLDNVEQSTYVTQTQLAASLFPSGEELNFLAGVKNGAASATALDIDWYQVAQDGST